MSTSEPSGMTTVGSDLYAALEPMAYADAALGWPLARYLSSIGLILEDTAALVRVDDQGNDGWSAFADPQRCPDSYLYTLAQWAGVRYPRRMSLTDLRALIGPHAPGLWRGTKSAILAAVQRWLTPGGVLYFEERADGDPYKLRIFSYTFDTLDQAAIEAELFNVIPAGLILDYEVREGQTYGQLRDSMATYADVKATYPTYADVVGSLPP
jgi:hypothetical protein